MGARSNVSFASSFVVTLEAVPVAGRFDSAAGGCAASEEAPSSAGRGGNLKSPQLPVRQDNSFVCVQAGQYEANEFGVLLHRKRSPRHQSRGAKPTGYSELMQCNCQIADGEITLWRIPAISASISAAPIYPFASAVRAGSIRITVPPRSAVSVADK